MTEDEIRRQMYLQFSGSNATVLGKVVEIDETERTCSIEDDGLEIPGVRLQCIIGGNKGIVVYPKKDSQALAVRVEGSDELMLVACSDIENIRIDVKNTSIDVSDKIYVEVGESEIEVKSGEIIFNGGKIGMTKTDELTKKINALEQRCNDIVVALQGVTIALAPSGTFPLAPYFTMTPLTTTLQSDLENTSIKH